MSRAQRLLELIQILRGHRHPVVGAYLAQELHISLRTLYRDIATLQSQGARIEGEPGVGYVLRPGFMLPPLMFSEEETEALVLGSRWVADRGDDRLGKAAMSALAKVAAVLPGELRESFDATGLLVGPRRPQVGEQVDLSTIRLAIRSERRLMISYRSLEEIDSARTVWPFALGYFDDFRVLIAWCEQREDFRHFRTERISALTMSHARYPRRRQILLNQWRELEKSRSKRFTADKN